MQIIYLKHSHDIESIAVQKDCLSPPILLLREWKTFFTGVSPHYSTMEVIPVNVVCHYSYIRRYLSLVDHTAVRKQQEII
jgi:hypothetical protein